MEGEDSIQLIREDLDMLLNSREWLSFLSSLSNDYSDLNNYIDLDRLTTNISNGVYDRMYPFTHFNNNIICDSFQHKPSISFLKFLVTNIADRLVSNYLDTIISKHSKILLDLKLNTVMNTNQKDIIAQSALRTAFLTKNKETIKLLQYLNESTIKSIFKFLCQENEKFSMEILSQTFSATHFNILREEADNSLKNGKLLNVNFILDFLEKNDTKLFTYSDAFRKIFDKLSCQELSDVLVSRASVTRVDIMQVQAAMLNPIDAAPLRKTLQKYNDPKNTFSDEQLRLFGNMFETKKEIPSIIMQMYVVDRMTLEKSVIPAMENLAGRDKNISSLLDEMRKQKMIIKPKKSPLKLFFTKDVSFEALVNCIDELSLKDSNFASDLFDCFNNCLYKRHRDDIKKFMIDFDSRFLKCLSAKSLMVLSEKCVDYLCSDLILQHRFSLATIALRLPIQNYYQKIFDSGKENEVRTLAALHDSSIATADYIKLRETRFINDGDPISLAVMDKEIVLRYRWRYLRGDAMTFVYGLPEHAELCEDDEELFLKWELQEKNANMNREEIIEKLGIKNTEKNFEIILSTKEIEETALRALIPLFRDVKISSLPTFVNIKSASCFPLIWNVNILKMESFQQELRKFPIETAKSFIKFVPDGYEAIVEQFPTIIACVCVNEIQTTYEVFDKASLSIRRSYDFSNESFPFVLAVVCTMFMKEQDLNPFEYNFENWKKAFVFFSIMRKQYNKAIQILEKDINICAVLLRNECEQLHFCNRGSWAINTVKFILYCASIDFYIDSPVWRHLIDCCRYVPWPQEMADDDCVFATFETYVNLHQQNSEMN
ncbi:hypothetical protein TVAG_359880 [Trichomonas vaginalis G3]|uniref:Uncharacterized protein n=1 Tax=Trichomonas vaginalis (strain ATCC PRA-98 / G3) TaxID=412133 RepID=A2DTA7_TRIV3|nr:hypothetical protein TVAGG3_0968090 [Trichomonas vaginalis G3]EAY16379.1 hypothetical protein TVAG_359880 [Trichomonas vaginalis G3]KAI5488393.1 hypothetical protein TVAGG3_0968090 [Trichomonas vaginalis G3]|eukprot:XP_001328602.1 hypothetical protein [Trichomonas vaginalis G3]